MNKITDIQFQESIKLINSAFCRINGLYQSWAQKNNLNSFHLNILCALYIGENLTQKDICCYYEIPKQTVCKVIKLLEKQNYVQLVPDTKDKRGKKIIVTASGREYIARQLSPILDLDKRIIQRIGIDRYRQFIEMVNDFGDAAESEMKL